MTEQNPQTDQVEQAPQTDQAEKAEKPTTQRTLTIEIPEAHYASDAQIEAALEEKLEGDVVRDGDYTIVRRSDESGGQAKVVVEFATAEPTAPAGKPKK